MLIAAKQIHYPTYAGRGSFLEMQNNMKNQTLYSIEPNHEAQPTGKTIVYLVATLALAVPCLCAVAAWVAGRMK